MGLKEIINISNLDANKALSMLGNTFPFPVEVDSKGRLVVTGKVVKVFIKFKSIGQSTEIKFAGSKWVNIAKVLFIPFYYIYANIEALNEHKSLVREIANALRQHKTVQSDDDISAKLLKLKEMKDQGIISEEEFNKKKSDLIGAI